jgi:hypothetical protein
MSRLCLQVDDRLRLCDGDIEESSSDDDAGLLKAMWMPLACSEGFLSFKKIGA